MSVEDESKGQLVLPEFGGWLPAAPAQRSKRNQHGVYAKDDHKKIDVEAESDPTVRRSMPVQVITKSDFRFLKPLLRLNYMFLPDYEFYIDDLPQLWCLFGGSLWVTLDHQFFQFSRIDHSTGSPMYKLNKATVAYYENNWHLYDDGIGDDEYLRIDDVGSCIPKTTCHVSIRGDTNSSFLENLYETKGLETLLVLRGDALRIDSLPRDLFQELPSLQTLDISHTNITELPISIVYAQQLRYLNLSYTSIVELPNSLCNVLTLKTLKLVGCLKLKCLPKAIRQLTSLLHLDVDVSCLLVSMPPGVGDLKKLETLPAFVVGKRHGWHITELRKLYIRQSLRILKLENVSSAGEAKKAALHYKHFLHKLEFHWSRLQDGFEVLENLCPRFSLKELRIVGYGGAKFPSWVGDRNFSFMKSITIHNCSQCDVLPTLGRLPSLKFLRISDMDEVKVINQEFLGISLHSSDKAFPSLEQFICSGMPELNEWIAGEKGNFPVLRRLNISDCSKLMALPELSALRSLEQLEISLCPSLESFPDKGLPVSLQSIVIIGCPLLKERCQKEVGEDWVKLAYIPNIWIDYQHITQVQETPEVTPDER